MKRLSRWATRRSRRVAGRPRIVMALVLAFMLGCSQKPEPPNERGTGQPEGLNAGEPAAVGFSPTPGSSTDEPAVADPPAQGDPPSTAAVGQTPGDSERPLAERVVRARQLADRARGSFEKLNHQKALEQVEAALRELAGIEDAATDGLSFEAERLRLHVELRLGKLDDPLDRLAGLEQRFAELLRASHYREAAADLAYAGRFDASLGVLARAQDRLAGNTEGIAEYRELIARLRGVVSAGAAPKPNVAPNYLQSLEKNRPPDAEGLVQYAIRAMSVQVYDKALLALHDAELNAGQGGETAAPDPRLAFLIGHNRVLAWIELNEVEEAASAFAALAFSHAERVDWISYYQIGTRLAEKGARDQAERVLEEGKQRHPDKAAHFDAELAKLRGS